MEQNKKSENKMKVSEENEKMYHEISLLSLPVNFCRN